ncbi:hypothetical protein OUZ56_010018 [Daphnia magna]|uniref:Uncharacterized protein n=1 Tax=Daphnia magna TaxID=35525 RepID=A0ABR0AHS1_9CRUS|nr:hypothetical protein OUZ56_010018 [Daphnia magna]
MCRFMGMVEKLTSFSADKRGAAKPLRPLLSTSDAFIFHPTTTPLPTSNPHRRVPPQRPRIRQMQLHADGWIFIQCVSRFVSDAESRYATMLKTVPKIAH